MLALEDTYPGDLYYCSFIRAARAHDVLWNFKLVLKHSKYYIGSGHPDTLQFLLKDAVIHNTKAIPQQTTGTENVEGLTMSKAPTRLDW